MLCVCLTRLLKQKAEHCASLHQFTGEGGSNVGYAVAAALQRADRLQLQSGALAPSEPFSDAITRILQARR